MSGIIGVDSGFRKRLHMLSMAIYLQFEDRVLAYDSVKKFAAALFPKRCPWKAVLSNC